jgi:hypothetical protein
MSGFQRLPNIFPKKRSKDYFELSLPKHGDMILSLLIIKIFSASLGFGSF